MGDLERRSRERRDERALRERLRRLRPASRERERDRRQPRSRDLSGERLRFRSRERSLERLRERRDERDFRRPSREELRVERRRSALRERLRERLLFLRSRFESSFSSRLCFLLRFDFPRESSARHEHPRALTVQTPQHSRLPLATFLSLFQHDGTLGHAGPRVGVDDDDVIGWTLHGTRTALLPRDGKEIGKLALFCNK